MYTADTITDALTMEVSNHVEQGCRDVSRSLGFCRMPHGYALMLDYDGAYFYWLRHDGAESAINWNKWAVYRWAKHGANQPKEPQR